MRRHYGRLAFSMDAEQRLVVPGRPVQKQQVGGVVEWERGSADYSIEEMAVKALMQTALKTAKGELHTVIDSLMDKLEKQFPEKQLMIEVGPHVVRYFGNEVQ